jgi:HEAT repeat protein
MAVKHIPLKTAVIDCFFALPGLTEQAVVAFAATIVKELSDVKLHFVKAIASTAFLPAVAKFATQIVSALSRDVNWRIRLGTISLLWPVAERLNDPAIATEFVELCVRTLDDEAFPVRTAAVEHIAKAFAGKGEVPEIVKTLAKTDSFRKRQSATGILAAMYPLVQGPIKEAVLGELRALQQDPVSNVAYAAGQAIAAISE